MEISAKLVQELRTKSGVGMMDCKQALQETGGDLEAAIEYLRVKGLASAAKREGKATGEGLIISYIHPGNKLGVLLEINCETDFVARTPEFHELAKDIAMQIAAASPLFVRREEIPQNFIEDEKHIFIEQARSTGKPDNILEKIVQGKLDKHLGSLCLLEQPFIKDNNKIVAEYIKEAVTKLGENIVVTRFARFKMGEELDK
jgi:elongation factor Ts